MCSNVGLYFILCYNRMLDTLAGKKDKHCITGALLMDGKKLPENFKLLSGYVVQVN